MTFINQSIIYYLYSTLSSSVAYAAILLVGRQYNACLLPDLQAMRIVSPNNTVVRSCIGRVGQLKNPTTLPPPTTTAHVISGADFPFTYQPAAVAILLITSMGAARRVLYA